MLSKTPLFSSHQHSFVDSPSPLGARHPNGSKWHLRKAESSLVSYYQNSQPICYKQLTKDAFSQHHGNRTCQEPFYLQSSEKGPFMKKAWPTNNDSTNTNKSRKELIFQSQQHCGWSTTSGRSVKL